MHFLSLLKEHIYFCHERHLFFWFVIFDNHEWSLCPDGSDRKFPVFLFSSKIGGNLSVQGFPGGMMGKPPANVGSIPESGWSPGEGNGNPLRYSCLENPTDRGAWRATVHGVTESWTGLSDSAHTQPECLSINRWAYKPTVVCNTTEDHSAIKGTESWNMLQLWRHYDEWNKPNTKGQILHDFTHMKDLKSSNS